MADIQIDEAFFSEPEFSSKDFLSARLLNLIPQTNPFIAGTTAVNSSCILDYTTGSNEYLDLGKAKWYLETKITTLDSIVKSGPLIDGSIGQARLYVNGVLGPVSNNYWADAALSKRIGASAIYNKSENEMYYDAYVNTATDAKDDYKTFSSHLDGLFVRSMSRAIIPPNTNIKIEMNMFNDGPMRAAGGLPSADTLQLIIHTYGRFYLKVPSLQSPQAPTSWILKFVSPRSFLSSATQTNQLQYDVSPNTIVMGLAFQTATLALSHATTGTYLIYSDRMKYTAADWKSIFPAESKGSATAGSPTSVQFRFGSQSIPLNPIETGTYGYRDAWIIYQQTKNVVLGDSGGETFEEYLTMGPIWLVPVVKSSADRSNQATCMYTLSAAPTAANAIFFTLVEQIYRIAYDVATGANIATEGSTV